MSDLHGFIDDLDEATYHAHPTSLSVTGAKVLLKAPALFQWQRTHPVHKDVFDFGTAAHALVLGVGPKLIVHEYDAEKVKSPKATSAWKEQQATARKAGDILLLPDEHQTVQDMADALSGHAVAMELLSAGKPEVSAFAVDEETGVPRRCRVDYLRDDLAVDYKSAASVHPEAFAKACHNYGYAMQHPWYLDLLHTLGHTARSFVFIAQEKEAPYLVETYELDYDAVAWGRERNGVALQRFRDCTDSGHWPGYTGDQTIKPLSLPGYAFRQEIPA